MCSNLIGKEYEYGATGQKTDCIALVVTALDLMGIENPGLKRSWYSMSLQQIARELKHYTDPILEPAYDGDIILLDSRPPAFGVVWQTGILYINRQIMKVDWKPIHQLSILRSYRMKGI